MGRGNFGLLRLGSQLTLKDYEVKLKVKMSLSLTQTYSITRPTMPSFVLNGFEACKTVQERTIKFTRGVVILAYCDLGRK